MHPNHKPAYLEQLREGWKACTGCELAKQRQHTVFGYGNPHADVMIIGEAPGATEDDQGKPFVGIAGQMLDQLLAQVSVHPRVIEMRTSKLYDWGELREILLQEYYYTNVVMCRPPDNRDPQPKEIEACKPRLMAQIQTIEPAVILAFGKFACSVLLGVKDFPILSSIGKQYDMEVQGQQPYKTAVYALPHPSYLLRNPGTGPTDPITNTVWSLARVHEALDRWRRFHYNQAPPPGRVKASPEKWQHG